MKKIFDAVNQKVSHLIWSLILNGLILTILAILIVWTDFMLKLTVGLFVLVIAFSFFYGAYKMGAIRKEVKKFFDIK